ncbi:VCBS repeat-containing protein [Chryseolinea sp. T2]|uniref:VCBS repeat-containing protein n=1 Tax=Chryseolinea sp. T2 TaxID=3129255 RepID=UPI0030779B4C
MNRRTIIGHWSLAFWIVIALPSCDKKQDQQDQVRAGAPLFTLLDSSATHVGFINSVEDKDGFNILSYRNFYNGGGVAIGDINNDSLPDLYFTSNQHANKLYLNKGNFEFEDITSKAGVGGSMTWSTGVTMVDINNDGWLDIYVCNSGDVDGGERENELFINNGDLTFTERAKELNLANEGYSTHAAFFDYDADGDLDCYILNNSFKDPGKIELYKKMREVPSPLGDKLMRNDGGVFTDVTLDAGIYSSVTGFGLGIAVSDLNADNLPDLYISNDFWERDYLYINQGNGKYKEDLIERINYSSLSSMGADIADLNGDGSPEIFTTDMLPSDNHRIKTTIAFDPYHLEDAKYRANFHYQMVQNCLHLNNGNGQFQEIAFLSGVAATDWSWGALIFDFDNDGQRDIFVSNGINKDIMSMDFREFIADSESKAQIVAQRGEYGDRAMISYMPAERIPNYAFVANGKLKFVDKAPALGLATPSTSNGSAYGDLDNDGDLDLIVNNVNQPCFIYRNESNQSGKNGYLKVRFKGTAPNGMGIGASVTASIGNRKVVTQNFNTRGFQSSIEPNILIGVGPARQVDSLKVVWPNGKVQVLTNVPSNSIVTFEEKKATQVFKKPATKQPDFKDVSREVIGAAFHHENSRNDFNQEILLHRMLSTEGPRILKGDVNKDGREDFILLGASGDSDKLFVQNASGNFVQRISDAFGKNKVAESTCGALADVDGDGDLDVIIGSGGNEIEMPRQEFLLRIYHNDGKGNFTRDQKVPPIIGNFGTLKVCDYDDDGDVDVFVGARAVPGNYGLPGQSYLLINDKGQWMNVAPPELGNAGMVTDASWADVDKDGDKDLVVIGDWMSITIFRNDRGVIEGRQTIANSEGWWTRIEPTDVDSDGDMDFIVGNWGMNSKFQASASRPMSMHVNDYDGNGKSEFIMEWFAPRDTVAYPFATKSELVAQLPGLRKSILKYNDYAPKTYSTLFPADLRSQSLNYRVTTLQTSILKNSGDGNFTLEPLPIEAQLSPVFAIVAEDLDNDKNADIWLGGNFYALKPQVGRQDASRGVFLKGDGKGNYVIAGGPWISGEVRDACVINSNGVKRMLVARNNANMAVFEYKR